MSLRTRLTIVYGGMLFAAGLVLLGVTYVLVGQHGPGIASFVGTRMGSGDTVYGSGQASDADVNKGNPPVLRTTNGDVITADQAPQFILEQQKMVRDSTMTAFLTQGAIALVLVSGVSVMLGWLVAGRVLAPLTKVTETARRIADAPAAEHGLRERIALTGPRDEVKELADTFDVMVARLDRSFEGQRRFVANASHELRTPLTLNRALVEVAMHRRTASPDVKQLGETLLEINKRHEQLISGLLMLAKSEVEIGRPTELDLADVVAHVEAQSAAEARDLDVAVRADGAEARTSGDPILLERLAQNLLDNAIRHNSPGGFAEISSGTLPDGSARLEVANSGPAIPPYDIPGLFEPFRRYGDERLVTAKGAGLGLSIVQSVVRAHGGQVAARPREGGGLVVTVTLPGS
ncbi:sensor histidine kinase [Hamadaea tsunoensis]|uniref:sensor histidine kinase n=1 Tax=Hamadaea tsunoensis TaxID=53368 RepID=UPI000421132B|nr:HAMP domain-containing sensor histidine kinase [Hamadaea tsunoensis]